MKAQLAAIFSLALMGYAAAQEEQEDKPGVVAQTGAAAGQAAAATAGTAVAGPIGGAVAGVVGGAIGGTVGKAVEGKPKKKTCERDDDKDCEKQVAQGQQDNQPADRQNTNQQTAQQ